jgi:hypothetical protein
MPDDETADPEVRRGTLASGVRWFFAEGAGTLVALTAGIVAVLFTLFPDLKPFTATTQSADITVLAVERGVTRDEWRWRLAVGDRARHDALVREDKRLARRAADEPCRVLGDQPGFSVYVRTDARGFKRRELTVRAALYRHPSRRRIRFLTGTEGERYRALARVPIDAPTAGSVQEIWVYDPGIEPRPQYFVRVAVHDPSDHVLDVADSPHFWATSFRHLADVATGCRAP